MKQETSLARRTSLENLTLAETKDIGQVFVQSGYFKDAKDASQAIVKVLYGRELGFSPVVSMMGIHIVEGKPELSANILATLVKQSGRYNYRVTAHTNEECVIEFSEGGESVGASAFSMEDAKRAGLVRPGSGWAKYPKAMLFARAMSSGVRTHCPDVAAGCPVYSEGEISNPAGMAAESRQEPAQDVPEETVAVEPEPKVEEVQFINARECKEIADRLTSVLGNKNAATSWLSGKGWKDQDGKGSTRVIPKEALAGVFADIEELKQELAQVG